MCFCLGITAVDPVRMGLLFERFLSRERAEPPDIDLDIEHERREEVIQHVYTVYGRDHAAMVCNVIRYRPRSAVRDVGKVLGIPETALDRAAKHLSMYGGVEADALARAGLAEHGTRALDHLARLVRRDPRVPAPPLGPPRRLPARPRAGARHRADRERGDAGPHRDPVGQGRPRGSRRCSRSTCSGSARCTSSTSALDLLRAHRGIDLTMATIPAEDAATYDMICTADTVGTFQIESRAQMSMLPRLQAAHVLRSRRRGQRSCARARSPAAWCIRTCAAARGLETVEYPHACLEPVLAKTLGVPLFQEQVMKLAVVAADYTPGEADQLRRDMAAWRRSGRIEKHRERLISAMEDKGIAREFGERVFEQIRGFGEYGFPECVTGDTRVIDADTGAWVRIDDVVHGRVPLAHTLTCSHELEDREAPRARREAERREARVPAAHRARSRDRRRPRIIRS